MKLKFMTAVSVIAILVASAPVYAANVYAEDQESSVSNNLSETLNNADTALSNKASDIKAFFIGTDNDARLKPVLIYGRMTAHGLIGREIMTPDNKSIGTVKDIIIGKDGKPVLVVVSDGGLLGIGNKVAAFDYNKVVTQNTDGSINMALSQNMIDRAADFSYDQKDWAKAKVIPTGAVSTNMLIGGDVYDSKGKKTASIENVYFQNAAVTQIIVGFNKTLGMGGDKASLDFDDMRMVRKGDRLDFKLTENQSKQFKNFKSSVSK